MASSSMSALADEAQWERLPDELLLRVLERGMRQNGKKRWCGHLREVCRRWRAMHDASCQQLQVRNGITDEVMHALWGRLPALECLILREVCSLTEDGLRAVGGLTTLNELYLGWCSNVTEAVLRELRALPALTQLSLPGCNNVTDAGLRELRGLTKLTYIDLYHCSMVTNAGLEHLRSLNALTTLSLHGTSITRGQRDALKAALPAVTFW
jgi:hypothetical protein